MDPIHNPMDPIRNPMDAIRNGKSSANSARFLLDRWQLKDLFFYFHLEKWGFMIQIDENVY